MSHLKYIENKSIFILREVKKRFKSVELLWSGGKDSTVLLWLCRKAFFGEIPFNVVHIDTGTEFEDTYEFIKKYSKIWKLNLKVIDAKKSKTTTTCTNRKTVKLKNYVTKKKIDGLIVGIRRDEHAIRGMERYFSPRDKDFKWHLIENKKNKLVSEQDAEFSDWGIYATEFSKEFEHVRIHPLLHWTENDIWNYIKTEKIPIINLYYSSKGKRFRSIGCKCCSVKINSKADNIDKIIKEIKNNVGLERKGRDTEKEYQMQKLRSLGYL